MVAVTNIELYEALKKDLNEDAARMIAEVIPPARDLVTKADLNLVKADLNAGLLGVERRIASLERRFFAIFAAPLWGGIIVALARYLFEV